MNATEKGSTPFSVFFRFRFSFSLSCVIVYCKEREAHPEVRRESFFQPFFHNAEDIRTVAGGTARRRVSGAVGAFSDPLSEPSPALLFPALCNQPAQSR
jgi:hypothetical protein